MTDPDCLIPCEVSCSTCASLCLVIKAPDIFYGDWTLYRTSQNIETQVVPCVPLFEVPLFCERFARLGSITVTATEALANS